MTPSRSVGRNDPCPCGSGKKYKRCHGGINNGKSTAAPPRVPPDIQEKIAAMEAMEAQRERQQGFGRPIISEVFGGQRIVAVGNHIFHSPKWKTFHDFLFDYIATAMGKEWGSAELAKLEAERHPLLQLYALVQKYKRAQRTPEAEINSAPMTGAVSAYLGLAYNLYLLAHNAALQDLLLRRLRNASQFHAAMYETFVAAAFIKAGFSLELEKEDDPSTTHCEFTARHPKTGRTFSVEAKARGPHKDNANVMNQLYSALKKKTDHPRVVFIDVNREIESNDRNDPLAVLPWLRETLSIMRRKERTLQIGGVDAPAAYVILTTQPFHLHLESDAPQMAFVAEGFKIAEFKLDSLFRSVREARLARDAHIEMYDLLRSMDLHRDIPITFDGEIPEFAYDKPDVPRLLIGSRYRVPDTDGSEREGVLEEAVVSEKEGKAMGVYRLDNGQRVIAASPLTPEELSAYRKYPDTFFGVKRQTSRNAVDALDLYDVFIESYRHTPKKRLLELMKSAPDLQDLATLDQPELAVVFSERMAESTSRKSGNRPGVTTI